MGCKGTERRWGETKFEGKKETQKRRRDGNEERGRYNRRGSRRVDEKEKTRKGRSRKRGSTIARNYAIFRAV